MADRTTPAPSGGLCTMDGNDDLYGLGIRLGVYLQWIASIFAYNCSSTETSSMRGVNTCFQLATVVGLIVMTTQPDEVHAIDVFLLLMLALGASCDYCTRPKPATSERLIKINPLVEALATNQLGDVIRMTIAAAVCAYGTWFAFTGIDRLGQMPCGDFGHVFLFAKIQLDGGYRKFLKVIFITALLIFVTIASISGYLIYGRYMTIWRSWGIDRDTHSEDEGDAGPFRPSKTTISMAMAMWSFFVLTIELTIKWNGVTGVSSCRSFSQLFPIIIAGANLLRLVSKLAMDMWRGKLAFS